MWSKQISFKVDIANIIAIMGQSLYSRPETPVRELIQNAHDAIMRRRQRDVSFRGRIDIVLDAERGMLSFTDDGIGLTAEEAETYLGTLGSGVTGLLKGRGSDEDRRNVSGSGDDLIGQFGIGLFSGFMLADRISVESLSTAGGDAVHWSAGAGTEILLRQSDREKPGTTVELQLKEEFQSLAESEELVESVVKEFADFLDIPIHLNGSKARINLIHAAWFDQTPEKEQITSELATYFNEQPLDVISIRCEIPASVTGAIYISPQRTPGFTDQASVAVTVRRMVISRHIFNLLPGWGSFFRGVLELHNCAPTASREDLVRDKQFDAVRQLLEDQLFEHFEKQLEQEPRLLEATVDVHRFTFAGAALEEPRLRKLLAHAYQWNTSHGRMSFTDIVRKSEADMLLETEADAVVWFNADHRQESWMNRLFGQQNAICVHATRSFEETLLATMAADVSDKVVHVRMATFSAPRFAETVLGLTETAEADTEWQQFLEDTGATVQIADMQSAQPAIAFVNERFELYQSIEDLKKEGDIPLGFQKIIESHFEHRPTGRNEIVLNKNHRVVKAALSESPSHPVARVLRLIVTNALQAAGATVPELSLRQQQDDLSLIAEQLRR